MYNYWSPVGKSAKLNIKKDSDCAKLIKTQLGTDLGTAKIMEKTFIFSSFIVLSHENNQCLINLDGYLLWIPDDYVELIGNDRDKFEFFKICGFCPNEPVKIKENISIEEIKHFWEKLYSSSDPLLIMLMMDFGFANDFGFASDEIIKSEFVISGKETSSPYIDELVVTLRTDLLDYPIYANPKWLCKVK